MQNDYIHNEKKLSRKRESAFKNNAADYELTVESNKDPLEQMQLMTSEKTHLIYQKLDQLKGVKCNEMLEVIMEKQGADDETTIENSFTFISKAATITNKNDIGNDLQNMRDDILGRIDRFTMNESGWTIAKIRNHRLHLVSYDPLRASSYIPLPIGLQNKKSNYKYPEYG